MFGSNLAERPVEKSVEKPVEKPVEKSVANEKNETTPQGTYVPPGIPKNTRWPLHTNALSVNWNERGVSWPEESFSVSHYPLSATALETALADRFGVTTEQVLVTAGADQAIQLLSLVAFQKGGTLIFPEPGFSVFPLQARVFGGEIVNIFWAPGGPLPREEIISSVSSETRLVVLTTPNNPTGTTLTRADLKAVAEGVLKKAPTATVVLDCIYGDYADEDLTGDGLKLPNVVVLRSFSKLGFAGDRVGYALGSVEKIDELRRFSLPYPVAETSLRRALWALNEGWDEVAGLISATKIQRDQLFKLLIELGAEPVPSQANFILAKFADAQRVFRALSSLGVLVRAYAKEPLLANYLRISCPGDAAGFETLCRALRTAIKPETIIFDMDGVLADVSQSYREAIFQTVRSYGVQITMEDIAQTKTEPNSNNDWKVSLRLIERGGVKASLEEVTARFEELYQGIPGTPGLKETEELLPPKELLVRLAKRLPLGIVTGRPRTDAAEFLQSKGIEELFSAMVCMNETEPKPSPAPVYRCLELLGLSSAWMIGDTPDDIRASYAAEVVPIAVVAPGGNSAEALREAGAAEIIETSLETLEVLLGR